MYQSGDVERAWVDLYGLLSLSSVTIYQGVGRSDFKEHSVCYFFFKDNERQDNLATALCTFIHQLLDGQPVLVHHALPSWNRNG
ncbi:unnamed protein product [Clonostachys chloroleuca]|uniref:Nephrocystin 3-like N-terminal domain-containing protein n=1 Tax=Clonostachys chloroleuca TaxID=1926264 RepID=A0AA35M8D7_9HYPO|nr:unnamed protein product [Clonostachys chloroleuca]